MYGRMAQWLGSSWVEIGGTELHYLHSTGVAADIWTPYVLNAGQTIGQHLATVSASCWNPAHSHMSGDVGTTSLMLLGSVANETCWTELEYAFQCPGSYPTHLACPNSYSATLSSTSGTIWGVYTCELWSKRFRSVSDVTFLVSY
jgi:hypothetical protein